MSSCLFECLKEAGLERYCAPIRRHGYETAFSLLYLPPAELCDIGISTDADRQKFLQLVQIIASFHQGGKFSPRRSISPQRKRTNAKVSGSKPKRGVTDSMTNSVLLGYDSSDSSSNSQESRFDYMLSPRRRNKTPDATNHSQLPAKRTLASGMDRPIPTSPTKHRRQQRKRIVNRSNDIDSDTRKTPYFVVSQANDEDHLLPDVVNGSASSKRDRIDRNANIDDKSRTNSVTMSTDSLKVHKVLQTSGYNYGLPRDSPQQHGSSVDSPKSPNIFSSPMAQRPRYDPYDYVRLSESIIIAVLNTGKAKIINFHVRRLRFVSVNVRFFWLRVVTEDLTSSPAITKMGEKKVAWWFTNLSMPWIWQNLYNRYDFCLVFQVICLEMNEMKRPTQYIWTLCYYMLSGYRDL